MQIDQDCLGCEKSGSKVMSIENQMKRRFLYILWPSCGPIWAQIVFVYQLIIYIQLFFFPTLLLAGGFCASGSGFLFCFFWLFFIAPEWVSYQYRSLPSQQIKMKNAYHFLFLTRCLNHASVLLGLFSPLTHFNTYQLQVLVLPKILRMQIKIPFPKISILCFLTCF